MSNKKPVNNCEKWVVENSSPSSKKGLKNNEIRKTLILNETYLSKIKAIAYWERLDEKDLIKCSIKEFVDKYEKKRTLKPIPNKIRNI